MPLIRCAVFEIATGDVVNVIDYEVVPVGDVPGYGPDYSALPNEEASIGWIWDGEAFINPNPPAPPVYMPPSILLAAQARLVIANGDVSGVETAANIAAAFQMDTGVYWLFFETPQPDTDYGVLPQARNGGGLFSDISAQETDYIEITVTDRTGNAVNPTQLFVSVQRAV